jgi:hypothetical protein
LKLFKIGARVITSVRRIKLSLPDAYPYKAIFFQAHQRPSGPVATTNHRDSGFVPWHLRELPPRGLTGCC